MGNLHVGDAPVSIRRRTVVVAAVVVVVLLVALVARLAWQDAHRSALRQAVDVVPASTMRLAFTDWSAVRRALDVPDRSRPARPHRSRPSPQALFLS